MSTMIVSHPPLSTVFLRFLLSLASLPCPTNGAVAASFLLPADFRARFDGGGFGLEPAFPDRAGVPDTAPFPDERP